MAHDLCTSVRDFWEWERIMPSNKRWRPVPLFSATFLVELIAIDILRPISKALSSNQSVLLIMDRCTTLERAVPMPNTIAAHIVSLPTDNRATSDWIPEKDLINIATQFIGEFFESLYTLLGIKQLITWPPSSRGIGNLTSSTSEESHERSFKGAGKQGSLGHIHATVDVHV